MSEKLILIAVGIAVACLIFFAGMMYERRANDHAEVKQIKADDRAAIEIEKKDDETEKKNIAQDQAVRQQAPDWAAVPLPDAVLSSLRSAGIRTKP